MKNKIQNIIDELEKEIERLKPVGNYLEDCSKEFSKMNKLSLKQLKEIYTESTNMSYVGFLMGEIQAYKEAQNYLNEIIQQYNQDYINKKETEKNIIDEIENTFPEKDIAILKQIIQKQFNNQEQTSAGETTSRKRFAPEGNSQTSQSRSPEREKFDKNNGSEKNVFFSSSGSDTLLNKIIDRLNDLGLRRGE